MADEIKKLSGESRIDALVLELKHKLGFHTSPEVQADAEKNDDARKAAGLKDEVEEKPDESEEPQPKVEDKA